MQSFKSSIKFRGSFLLSCIVAIAAVFLVTVDLSAQLSEGKPSRFEKPYYNFQDTGQLRAFMEQMTGGGEEDSPWTAFSDRENNVVYAKNEFTTPTTKKLKFLEPVVILEEKGKWVRIAARLDEAGNYKGIVGRDLGGKFPSIGWIPKVKLLHWTNALRSQDTEVHLKAFLVHKVDDLPYVQKKKNISKVKFFSSPDMQYERDEHGIHDFYYVLKREGDMWLLSKAYSFPERQVSEIVAGWVRDKELSIWKTRLALEPNFEPAAFAERKGTAKYRVTAYEASRSATLHAKEGLPNELFVIKPDPVLFGPEFRGTGTEQDRNRFDGGVMRMPVFRYNVDEYQVYGTGVVGEITFETLRGSLDSISEIKYAQILSDIRERKPAERQFNIFFLVEGTPALKSYTSELQETIKAISKKYEKDESIKSLRIGLAFYRDGKVERGGGDIFSIIPLTDRHENVVSFIDDSDFNAFGDDDEYTYFWYGLHQSLKDGGFNSSHTNILCILGRSPDVENEGFRRRTEAADLQAKSYKSRATIYETLGKLNVDVLAFTPASGSAAPLRDDVVDFCSESAILQYETYRNVSEVVNNFVVDRPAFVESSRFEELLAGAAIAKIYKAEERVSDCGNFFEDGVDEIVTFRQDLWKQVSDIFDYGIEQDEQKVSQGEYGPALAKLIHTVYEQNETVFKPEDLQNLLKRKFKLFTLVHVPVHIKGAKYPTCKFVVFFNEEELKKHQEIVARLHAETQQDDIKNKGDYEESILENLSLNIGQLLGIRLSADDIGNMSSDELEVMITGVQKETGVNVTAGTMTVRTLLKAFDPSTKKYWQEFLDLQYESLKTISSQGPKYQFSYVTSYGEVYYWVPIEQTNIFPPGK